MNLPHPLRVRLLIIGLLVMMLALFALATGQEVDPVRISLASGQVRYVAPVRTGSVPRAARKAALATASRSALDQYARHFGITDPAAELRAFRTLTHGAAGDVVRYRQLHDGIPVLGGELVLSLDGNGEVNSLSGEIVRDLKLRNPEAGLSATQARRIALDAIAKYYPQHSSDLTATTPSLWVYVPGLIGPDTGADSRLVWRVEVSTRAPSSLRELVLVNANDGGIALHFNQIESVLQQSTYTANGGSLLPGTLLCNDTQPLCTGGTNLDADLAHRHSRDTYNFYFENHGRDSFDGLGARLNSVVDFFENGGCPNAFWNGTQMVYCAGAPAADDVVAHELTHAVTDYTSELFYYYQSGAINEALSDLWGEFIDLGNGSGNDTPAVRWLLGEDFTGVGAGRNMANPPLFNQPDRMRSPMYYSGAADSGGVHRNSGVNNKAVTLMVDGGSFNGFTVNGIGISKVAALYYRVQTQHLTSGSDYADLFLALGQACRNMIGGPEGITGNDCVQVANALDAVEMNLPPLADATTEAALCSVNQVPVNAFYDSFEDAAANTRWSDVKITGTLGSWVRALLATDGRVSFYTQGSNGISNHALTQVDPVVVPPNAYLHFRHLFEQEALGTQYYDGGIVELSIDGGVTWTDASSRHSGGQAYNGTLTLFTGNPSSGSSAFVSASHGFVSTRYDLAALAGHPLQVRFRNTSDGVTRTGVSWVVDEVRIYTCETDSSENQSPVANAGEDQATSPAQLVTLNGAGSGDPDGHLTDAVWSQVSGTQVALTVSGRNIQFVAPTTPTQETLVFRITVTDNRGAIATDDVTVTVINQQPVAQAGADQSRKPRDTVLLQGGGFDNDGSIAQYTWQQTGGPAAGLDKLFNLPLQNSTPQGLWMSTTPYAVGASFLYLNFAPGALSNLGGAVINLATGSEFSTCLVITGTSCSTRHRLNLTGTVSAPAAAGNTPVTWTLQGMAAGTPVTGTFVFDAATSVLSGVQVTSGTPPSQMLSFRAPSVAGSATMQFLLTVTDNRGGTGTDEISITVTNLPPTVGAGADVAAKPRQVVPLQATAADPDAGIATLAWSQLSGPPVTLQNPAMAGATFTAPSVAASGTLVFRITATDTDGATATDDIAVTVTNVAPSANAGADKSVKAGANVDLQATGTDADGAVGTYAWTQTGGPAVSLSNANSSKARFKAPSAETAATLAFQVTVTDTDGATATDQVAVNVAAKQSGGGGATDLWLLAALAGLLALARGQARQRRR
ncbi:MAG: M4 family metallopeptidase [Pseudomonadota bacterium]|nr:M4 family metallopeptidase [Pseudomonadota bacterium]